jgi:molybdopterin-biosynthesis enzyme MoeA-like protein
MKRNFLTNTKISILIRMIVKFVSKIVFMKYAFIFPIFILIVSCSDNSTSKTNGQISSKIEADPASESELQKELEDVDKEEQQRLKELEASRTTMSFDRMKHDFGKVIEDSENRTTFIVKNSGKKPLIIESVSASCGCTTPTKPEKPIAPGKSDQIEVVFHPKVGQLNEQTKTVTVTANTEPSMSVLTITAFVNPKK